MIQVTTGGVNTIGLCLCYMYICWVYDVKSECLQKPHHLSQVLVDKCRSVISLSKLIHWHGIHSTKETRQQKQRREGVGKMLRKGGKIGGVGWGVRNCLSGNRDQ